MTYSLSNDIKCEIVETEIIAVEMQSVDMVYKSGEININLLVYNEIPTEVTTTLFQTANAYRSGSLRVYFNGQKLHNADWSEDSTNTFTISIPKILSDKIEVNYLKTS